MCELIEETVAIEKRGAELMGIDVKQELLEMRSESDRLNRVKELLEASAAAIRKQAVEKRASTNGKVDRIGPLGPH